MLSCIQKKKKNKQTNKQTNTKKSQKFDSLPIILHPKLSDLMLGDRLPEGQALSQVMYRKNKTTLLKIMYCTSLGDHPTLPLMEGLRVLGCHHPL